MPAGDAVAGGPRPRRRYYSQLSRYRFEAVEGEERVVGVVLDWMRRA